MKKVSQMLVAVLVTVGLFSCNVIDITKKRYSNGYYISISGDKKVKTQDHIAKQKANDVAVVKNETKIDEVAEVDTQDNVAILENNQETATANTVNSKNVSAKIKSTPTKKQIQVANNKPVFAIKSSKLAVNKLQMNERKYIEKKNSHSKVDDHQLLLIILAILLPPVAVYLVKGLDVMFWISLLLTICFYLPGIIFALLVVFGEI
jgi:uncharacterized membrane protein YqaE (UPF0057 family)